MTEPLSVLAFAGAALLGTWLCRPRGPVDALLAFPVCLAGAILIAGYALSALNAIGRVEAWALAGAIVLGLALGAAGFRLRRRAERDALALALRQAPARVRAALRSAAQGHGRLSAFEKRLLMPCLITAAMLALVNLDLVLNTAPHNWDSQTYHLARLAYAIQHGNLANFDANYWAQVTHPKNATVLLAFTYLASGRNENLTQLVQFLSYIVATAAVYGIARRAGARRFGGLFAAAVFALLTECLMQAITTQNDLLAAALIGCAAYGLLAHRERGGPGYLALAAAAAAMALGVKSSVLLAMPPLALVAAYALVPTWRRSEASPPKPLRHRLDGDASPLQIIAVLASAGAASVALFVLPAGYVENWLVYGHPIGPAYVRQLHAFEGQPISTVLLNGTRNLARFAFEFLSLDGLPPYGDVADAQRALRRLPEQAARAAGLELESAEATRAPFVYDKLPAAHEDISYWGVFGFALIWPAVGLMLIGFIRSPAGRVLALAGILFWVLQAYSGPYDPWRGRYSVLCAALVVPAVGLWIGRPHGWLTRAALTAIVLVGCFSGLSAVLGRANSAPEHVYSLDRVGQLTRNRPNYADPVRLFERIVPPDATVAVHFGEDMFEYPLFGAGLTRTLIPVNGFYHGPIAAPPQAQYLLYSSQLYADARPGDIRLGEDWMLRALPGQR
jgi:hypothetical protein